MEKEIKRCTGHCCKGFALDYSYDEVQEDFRNWQRDPKLSKIPQIETVAPMLIPLGGNKAHREFIYSCNHLDPNGNCKIYPSRPQFCRDFPDKDGCRFWRCTASESLYNGMSIFQKLKARWNWRKRF